MATNQKLQRNRWKVTVQFLQVLTPEVSHQPDSSSAAFCCKKRFYLYCGEAKKRHSTRKGCSTSIVL